MLTDLHLHFPSPPVPLHPFPMHSHPEILIHLSIFLPSTLLRTYFLGDDRGIEGVVY